MHNYVQVNVYIVIGFCPITINSWGLVFFAACHDGLNIIFDLQEAVCSRLVAELYAALRKFYDFDTRLCTALRNVYGFAQIVRILRTFVYGFCALSGLCVRIRIFSVKQLVQMNTDS